jgi:DNA-binding IclR family transcriptional regulator
MSKYKAPALAKGLDILDLLTQHTRLSFNEIQDLTKDNPASLSRYLHTLLEKNYIHKTPDQKYELGYKLMHLSNHKSL